MPHPLILAFDGTRPRIGEGLRADASAAILGRVTLGAGAVLGPDCVLRGDGEAVRVGARVWFGRRVTLHIVHDQLPAVVGDDVTVGVNTCIHACTVGHRCVIEADVAILDGAVVGDGVLITAGSTVFPRKVLEGGWVYGGAPAVPLRPASAEELVEAASRLRAAADGEAASGDAALPPVPDTFPDAFVAGTARGRGRIALAPEASLFFSSVADAGTGEIRVGARTNVQDNTVIAVGAGAMAIGCDTTVGHNVRMAAGRIGDRALVGIGAVLAPGTVVADDVLVAGGAVTEPGQVLESGWLWGGRPARALSRLDDARRAGMAENVAMYCHYARAYRALQRAASAPAG